MEIIGDDKERKRKINKKKLRKENDGKKVEKH